MAIFEIQDLTYYYSEREKPAIQGINLEINEGEFVLIVGPSGCGKSTLLRTLNGLVPDYYGGRIGGNIRFRGKDLLLKQNKSQLGHYVGMVFQDPEEQMILTSVEKEIAFGLENMGLPNQLMKRRVAEAIDFLDLNEIRASSTHLLSGGQKQKVVLASVLVMQPQVLLLDEPTSQLDPVNAEGFLNIVKRLNEEMGLTIVMVEQRLERCFHLADRIVAMEKGRIVQESTPEKFAAWAVKAKNDFIPPVARLFAAAGLEQVPLTIKEGRKTLKEMFKSLEAAPVRKNVPRDGGRSPVIKVRNLWYSYKPENNVLKGININFMRSEIAAVLGQNGAGKSTFLKTLNGLLKPQRGNVQLNGLDTRKMEPEDLSRHVGFLSQNPNDYLFNDTVQEEIEFTLKNLGIAVNGRADRVLELLQLAPLKKKNPRDLSGGERQRVALASVLAPEPDILLLDEPLRGLDYCLKKELGSLLKELCVMGKTIVLVTHDVEFAVEYADRIVLLFDGEIVADGDKHDVLSNAVFYSGQISKLFRGYEDDVVTFDEALSRIGGIRCAGA